MKCLGPAGAGPARVGCGNSVPVSGPDFVGRPDGEVSWESSPSTVTSSAGRGDGCRTSPVRVGPRAGGVSRTWACLVARAVASCCQCQSISESRQSRCEESQCRERTWAPSGVVT